MSTLRRVEHYSGGRRRFPFVDANEESHHSMHRTPLWCPIAISILRHQRGFAPFGAQNTTLVPDRNFHFATSTRILTHRCAEHHSGARSQLPCVDVNEDLHPSMRRAPLWCPIAYFYFTTSTRVRTLRCAERHSGSRSHIPFVDVNEDSHLSMRRTPLWCPTAVAMEYIPKTPWLLGGPF